MSVVNLIFSTEGNHSTRHQYLLSRLTWFTMLVTQHILSNCRGTYDCSTLVLPVFVGQENRPFGRISTSWQPWNQTRCNTDGFFTSWISNKYQWRIYRRILDRMTGRSPLHLSTAVLWSDDDSEQSPPYLNVTLLILLAKPYFGQHIDTSWILSKGWAWQHSKSRIAAIVDITLHIQTPCIHTNTTPHCACSILPMHSW